METKESRYHQSEFEQNTLLVDGLEQDLTAVERDWQVVTDNFVTALLEEAETGGPEVAQKVRDLAKLDKGFPSPDAFQYLMDTIPGSGDRVMERFKEIGDQRRKAELEELKKRESVLDANLFSHVALWFTRIFQSTTDKKINDRT